MCGCVIFELGIEREEIFPPKSVSCVCKMCVRIRTRVCVHACTFSHVRACQIFVFSSYPDTVPLNRLKGWCLRRKRANVQVRINFRLRRISPAAVEVSAHLQEDDVSSLLVPMTECSERICGCFRHSNQIHETATLHAVSQGDRGETLQS